MVIVILLALLFFKMFQIQYEEKTPRGAKKRCVSHGEQLPKGTEGEHLCRPNMFHTSWALGLHPLYSCTSPFTPSVLQELHPLPLWQVLCISYPILFSLPYSSSHYYLSQHCLFHIQVLQSSPSRNFISFSSLLNSKSCVPLCVHPQLLQLNLQVTEKGGQKSFNLRKRIVEFAVRSEFLWSICWLNIQWGTLWIFLLIVQYMDYYGKDVAPTVLNCFGKSYSLSSGILLHTKDFLFFLFSAWSREAK